MRYAIVVDVGASKVRVALGDEKGNLIDKLVERTDVSDRLSISKQIIRLAKNLLERFKVEVERIGVGSIGLLDLKNGLILRNPNLPFQRIPLVKPLEKEFKVVSLLNDCNAAVLGEKEFGLGKGLSNLVYITLSTGIGGGAIVDGKLLIGKDGNAVEIGHMVIDKEGKLLCGCGKPGHWEAYCSGANIPRFVRLWFKSHEVEKSKLFELGGTNLSKLTSKLLFEAAKLGDEVAIQVVEEIGRLNAMGFANLINAYDPELITVGGAVALNNPELVLRPIKKYVKDFAVNRVPKIALTPLGEDVTLYGLLAVVLRSD